MNILFLALFNLAGLTLRGTSYGNGLIGNRMAPLHVIFVLAEAIPSRGAQLCPELKRRHSTGIVRDRIAYVPACERLGLG